MEKEKIIIDCDPGSDDALAIILALYSGKLDLKAVCSVTGNGALDTTTRNGLNILSLCGREDIPLYRGSAVALDQKQPETVSAFGDDGLGGFAHTIASDKKEEDQNAVDFLVEYVNGHPKEITLFAIGPCTNIAHGDKHDVLSEIELEKFGVMLPLTVYLANELKNHGVRMKDNIITSDEMADQLQKIGKKE